MGIEVITGALLIMVASLVGVLFIGRPAGSFLDAKLPYLISFSAGVFLVTAGGLMLEVFALATSVWLGIGLILLGYVLAWSVHALMPETHHHHAHNCDHKHGVAARKLLIGDGVHNIADGIILVVAFAASPVVGVTATVSILIHEVLQEIAEFFVLRQAGYSVPKALLLNFMVSSTILIGVGLGYFALASSDLELTLLAISAGFFMHVVIHDLLPRKNEHDDSSSFFKQMLVVLCGVVLMAGVAHLLSEGHIHGGETDHLEDERSAH
jgi:zinc and cadmium transporter